MIAKLLISLVSFISLFFVFPSFTHAHILKTNGSVGAVMHITPDDDPIAGEESSFFFEFKDKENKFKPNACDCTITISQSGKEILRQPLFANNSDPSLTNASLSFTFPVRDVYTITIFGKPLTQNAFTEFTLTYDLRVERVSEEVSGKQSVIGVNDNWFRSHIPHIVIGVVSFGVLVWIGIKSNNKRE